MKCLRCDHYHRVFVAVNVPHEACATWTCKKDHRGYIQRPIDPDNKTDIAPDWCPLEEVNASQPKGPFTALYYTAEINAYKDVLRIWRVTNDK